MIAWLGTQVLDVNDPALIVVRGGQAYGRCGCLFWIDDDDS